MLIAKSRISDAAWQSIQNAAKNTPCNIKVGDLLEKDEYTDDFREGQELREKGRGKTRHLMSAMEFEAAADFIRTVSEGWMIKDGQVSSGKYGAGMQTGRVIGVAKNFTSMQKFYVGGKSREKESVVSLIANLPHHHRTPAFEGFAGKTAFWYLRLRSPQHMQYPMQGVIKVEIPNLPEQPITTELIDKISGALLAEQFVTSYGSDDRWHSHLYPIYQAEHAAKQQFISTQILQGIIRNALRTPLQKRLE